MLHMERYAYSRFWAIWDDQDLVAVVVDKKGAVELSAATSGARAAARRRWSPCASCVHHCRSSWRASAQSRAHAV